MCSVVPGILHGEQGRGDSGGDPGASHLHWSRIGPHPQLCGKPIELCSITACASTALGLCSVTTMMATIETLVMALILSCVVGPLDSALSILLLYLNFTVILQYSIRTVLQYKYYTAWDFTLTFIIVQHIIHDSK